MIKNKFLIGILAIFSILGSANQASAAEAIYTSTFSNTAIQGYDTVSYFVGSGVPVKGSKDFQTKWQGANWLFSSQENLDKFNANPEKYAPQYGGYCAWAVAQGNLVKGDANIYNLENGKLYLNYNKKVNNEWLPEKDKFIKIGDQKYPDLVNLN